MEEDGELIKVEIHAFEDEELNNLSSVEPNPFILPVNPESFSENYKVDLTFEQGQGNQGTNPKYSKTKPEELKFDFIFDGTKTIENYKSSVEDHSVRKQLNKFLEVVYKNNGDIHRPNFLKIHWGQFVFPCLLSNLDLNYTLFSANGEPLRIKVSATFINHIAQRERVARERENSPDLTHIRLVKAGDRLDLMTHKIYTDSKFVLEIAKANNLSSIRTIRPGMEMVFPPLDKNEAI